MFKIVFNKDKSLCQAYRCKNGSGKKDRFCPKHRKKHQKLTNPQRYTYNALKNNALRRKKPFFLTFKEFQKFCDETGYMGLKGRRASAYSIDRMDHTKGYSYDNIRILKYGQNCANGAHERDGNECPF